MSYKGIHEKLGRLHGPAREQSCIGCGEQARDWAYQHNAGAAELQDESGSPYSESPLHYAAMCRPCHARLDGFTVAARAALAAKRGEPEFYARTVQHGLRLSAKRRKCQGCDMTSNPGCVARHQKSSGHVGWTAPAVAA